MNVLTLLQEAALYAPTLEQRHKFERVAIKLETVRSSLYQALEYFEERQDADCEGDPLEYVPNQEMSLAVEMHEAIDLLGARIETTHF